MVKGSEPEDQKLTDQKVNTPAGMFIRDLPEGIKLQLTDQAIVEIVVNARDGGWLLARYLEENGEPTATVSSGRDITKKVNPPPPGWVHQLPSRPHYREAV